MKLTQVLLSRAWPGRFYATPRGIYRQPRSDDITLGWPDYGGGLDVGLVWVVPAESGCGFGREDPQADSMTRCVFRWMSADAPKKRVGVINAV